MSGVHPITWAQLMLDAASGASSLIRFGVGPADVKVASPVYLATPYTKWVRTESGIYDHIAAKRLIWSVAYEVRRLKECRTSAFSPILQAQAIIDSIIHVDDRGLFQAHHPLDAATWMQWCQPFLNVATAVVVPDIEGWDQSDGVLAEVDFAIRHQMPVFVYAKGDEIGL
jgi:hypothetical protein